MSNKTTPKYLGEEEVDISETEYAEWSKNDWIIHFIQEYTEIKGEDHKAWLIDQIARISLGSKVIMRAAKWDNGYTENRFTADGTGDAYFDWKMGMSAGGLCGYDSGVEPPLSLRQLSVDYA